MALQRVSTRALVVGVAVLAAKVGLSSPRLTDDAVGVVITWLVAASFVAVGLALMATAVPRVNAWSCLLIAATTIPGDMNNRHFDTGTWSFLGYVFELSYLPATVALVLRYPAARLAPAHRCLIEVLAFVCVGLRIPVALTRGNLDDNFYRPAGWRTADVPALWHDQVFLRGGHVVTVAVLLYTAGVLIRRGLRATGLARQSILGLTIIGATSSTAAAVDQAAWLHVAAWIGSLHAALIRDASGGLIPLALVADILRRRAAVAAVSDRILTVSRSGDLSAMRTALAAVLVDPHVDVWAPAPDGSWVCGHGRVCPHDPTNRVLREVDGADGRPLLRFSFARYGVRDDQLLGAVTEALRLGVENARLHADLIAALGDRDRALLRIVEAASAERRQVERDLHDGAQQRFLAVSAALAAAGLADDATMRDKLGQARAQLQEALAELRNLARGIHPAALTDGGLPAALPYLCAHSGVPVDLDIDPALATERPDPTVEQSIYFFVSEALANITKHARAQRVWVTIGRNAGDVEARVRDDGRGGAELSPHGGLTGLRDRAAALGGSLTVHGDPCAEHHDVHGTTLDVRIPFDPRRLGLR